jgi:protein-histidine pros-kinase
MIEISVDDTGIGIRTEDHGRLFSAFTQLDGQSSEGGTGLGLHLSRKLAESLGGSIAFESVYGEGSTFSLRLPGGDP